MHTLDWSETVRYSYVIIIMKNGVTTSDHPQLLQKAQGPGWPKVQHCPAAAGCPVFPTGAQWLAQTIRKLIIILPLIIYFPNVSAQSINSALLMIYCWVFASLKYCLKWKEIDRSLCLLHACRQCIQCIAMQYIAMGILKQSGQICT